MRRERIAADQAFFTERIDGRAHGLRRSRARAEAFAAHLDVDLAGWRERAGDVIVVVGSKGKGTIATCASATLAAAGLRVGTLTSPGLRSNRERIRVDGAAIEAEAYVSLVSEVSRRLTAAGGSLPDDGYLSPTGLFTLSALRHFEDSRCQVVVLEAGMGGRSDEVSLLAPRVVGVGMILAEHLGVLGGSVVDIAEEKMGVVRPETSLVVSVAQAVPGVAAVVAATAIRQGSRLEVVRRAIGDPGLAPGLGRLNAAAGVAAGRGLLEARGTPAVPDSALLATLATIELPGRLSERRLTGQTWIIDAATNPVAIKAALAHVDAVHGPPTSVLMFVPHQRDPAPLLEALRGRPVVRVRGGPAHDRPGEGAVMHLEDISTDSLGPLVLAIGPAYFVGELLAILDVDCERSFTAPSHHPDDPSRSTSR